MNSYSRCRPTEDVLFAALAKVFYRAVPTAYAQYCAHVSRVAVEVLARFGVAARLRPCQLWHVSRTTSHVMGFVGLSPARGHWDGHVVCATEANLIDAAVRGLRLGSAQGLPAVAGTRVFDIPSHVIARLTLDEGSALWWHDPPDGADLSLPPVTESKVRAHAAALVPLVEERLAYRMAASPAERLNGMSATGIRRASA